MTRVPKTKSRLSELRAKAKPKEVAVFEGSPGSRLWATALCAILAVMFAAHQTQIDGASPLLRAGSALVAAFFAVLAWYFLKRGGRRGPVLEVRPDGFGMALGFRTWIDIPWEQVEAFRYWEPTGMAALVKRRQSRWVGVLLLKGKGVKRRDLPWDARFEIWLNTVHNRPGLCLLHPFVRADILDVLQAFKDHAPSELDDYTWMKR